ncbi:PucR family transcriptional regulator [Sporosarcina sp. G11-34]|uniref:PucR family transcriptional regulator n=1 Tax=Sporosarcina sp. G11-34 TaxID=2849605 RepID=UPI0022A9BC80|nr:helix-turn-helix domain-containing protein [Sporosarcina sp. G11-34]MCZ2258457.1 helix-turn-helix domain-containing protein [Sporosarcina sp. G11-34]
MISQLRKIYPSLLIYAEGTDNLNHHYKWFVTDANVVIGIHEKEVTPKDSLLLATFLSPYSIEFPILTAEEQRWQKVIHITEPNAEMVFTLDNPYRFIYFSINKNQITPILFKSAIQELFGKQVPILWENEHQGIIIEELSTHEESTSYEQIIDILMSDLYVKIKFYVGPFQKDLKDVNQYYQSITGATKKVFTYSNKTVVTYIDAVPYLLIDQTEQGIRKKMSETVLQEYINDAETLKMIETFVQCNLNISETAKELHMHRNSLQYRLDRFLEKTGIDIRQFHQAMTVYLALLARK